MSAHLTQAILRRMIRDAVTHSGKGSKQGALAYGPWMKWIGALCVILFLGMAVGFGITSPKEERMLVGIGFGTFVVLGLVLLVESCRVRITYNEEGIETHSPWRSSRRIRWSEVTGCDYSEISQWYRIHTKSQGVLRVSVLLNGVAGLLQALPCEHPAYPPVSASGKSVFGEDLPEVLVPGKPVPVSLRGPKVLACIIVALGVAALLWHPFVEMPRLENFQDFSGIVQKIETKKINRNSMLLKLRVEGAPALLVCSSRRQNVERLLVTLKPQDRVSVLVERSQFIHPRKPLTAHEPQISMVGLRGDRWQFLRFEDHLTRAQKDKVALLWGGAGLLLFGLWLLWHTQRIVRKANTAQ